QDVLNGTGPRLAFGVLVGNPGGKALSWKMVEEVAPARGHGGYLGRRFANREVGPDGKGLVLVFHPAQPQPLASGDVRQKLYRLGRRQFYLVERSDNFAVRPIVVRKKTPKVRHRNIVCFGFHDASR